MPQKYRKLYQIQAAGSAESIKRLYTTYLQAVMDFPVQTKWQALILCTAQKVQFSRGGPTLVLKYQARASV